MLLTFFRSLLVYLADMMPWNMMGWAVVMVSLVVSLLCYFVYVLCVRSRARHNHVHHQLRDDTDDIHVNDVYAYFAIHPWRGFGVVLLMSVMVVFVLYMIEVSLAKSPSDLSSVYFSLSHVVQQLQYQFVGVNVASFDYSIWFGVIIFGFVLVELFLHGIQRWRKASSYGARHIIEVVFIVIVSFVFAYVSKQLIFGAYIYLLIHVFVSLLSELSLTPRVSDIWGTLQDKKQKKFRKTNTICSTLHMIRYYFVTSPYICITLILLGFEFL